MGILMIDNFLKEIKSQPQALEDTLKYIVGEGRPQFLKIRDFIKKGGITKLIFTGMGSNYISSYLPYYILNQYGIAVEMRETGEFLFNTFPRVKQTCFKDTGIIIISQSGESEEIRELLRDVNAISIENKPLTIGITNNPDSYLAYMTELQIFMNFDEEVSVTSKSYVCTLLMLYIMSKTIIGEFFTSEEEIHGVEEVLNEIRDLLQNQKQINKIWKDLVPTFGQKIEFLEFLSRGSSLTTAHQAALNFKEIVKSYSEANSVSTFRHGGIECLNENTNIVILSSDKDNFELNVQFIENLVKKWAFGRLLHITNQEFDERVKNLHDNSKIFTYRHGIKDPYLAPIMEIIVLQLLFYKIAEKKGFD